MNIMTPIGDSLQPLPVSFDYFDSLSNPINSTHIGSGSGLSVREEDCVLPVVLEGYKHSLVYSNTLPVAPESEHFGDNLCYAVVNSRGSGDNFSKVDIVVDFAEDELLDIVCVTELKTTLAKVMAAKVCHKGFVSWWSAWDVAQSHNDGVMVLVREGWAKYVQKIEYWKGQLLWIDFAFPGGLKL